jgi:hypothetical protein
MQVTVRELIQELQNFPEDMEVYTFGESVGGNEFDCEAYSPYLKTQYVKYEENIKKAYIAQRPCEATEGAKKCLIL